MSATAVGQPYSAMAVSGSGSSTPDNGGFSQADGQVYNGVYYPSGSNNFTQATGSVQNGVYQAKPQVVNLPSDSGNNNTGGSGGSGGSGSYAQQWTASGHTGDVPVGWHGDQPAQGPSQDEINKAIDDTYNASKSYLDQAEQQVNADYPTVQQDIQGQYDTGSAQLGAAHTSDTNLLGQQQNQADYSKESALAASRRLYSEVRQGYGQRFGGSSSAGEAGNDLANIEQQRQEGQTQRGYQDTTQTLNNHRLDVENQYNNGVQQLQVQKNASLNQANRDFQNKLLQISQTRAQNEQAKGQARLGALQDLRNQVFAINQQNTQFQQSLEAMRQQAGLQLQNYMALSGAGASNTANSLAAFNTAASTRQTTQLGAGGQGYQTQAPLSGQIAGNRQYDQYGNPLN